MSELSTALRALPQLQPYVGDPHFDALVTSIDPDRFTNAVPVLSDASRAEKGISLLLLTVATTEGVSDPAKQLALRILAEQFQVTFPPAAGSPVGLESWFKTPLPGIAQSVPAQGVWASPLNGSVVSAEKAYPSEVFSILAGVKGATFTDLGRLPQGNEGAKLVALRFLVANGKFWEKHYNWIESVKNRGGNQAAVDNLNGLLSRIHAVNDEPSPDLDALQADAYFQTVAENLSAWTDQLLSGQVNDGLIRFLSWVQRDAAFGAAARNYLRDHRLEIYRSSPVLADLFYLSTYDLRTYPATTVSAGQMQYVIVGVQGEMGVRLVKEATALGKVPLVFYTDDVGEDTYLVRLAKDNGGHALHLDGPMREAYKDYRQMAAQIHEFFNRQFGDTADMELARAVFHPGYVSNLAENDQAIRYLRRERIVFAGPQEDVVNRAGNKVGFKEIVAEKNPELAVPGIVLPSCSPQEVIARINAAYQAGQIRPPFRLKNPLEGGGRGQKVVRAMTELESQTNALAAESKSGWPAGLIVEQNIPGTSHEEMQGIADRYGQVCIPGDRDCTDQRFSQKIREEAPSSVLDEHPQRREAMRALARDVMTEINYVGAATTEFMLRETRGGADVYALEMNTRIQVEHPVTEESSRLRRGEELEPLNLVQWQLRIANGEPLDWADDDIVIVGPSNEFRVNAEGWNPKGMGRDGKKGGFIPQAGRLEAIDVPESFEVMAALEEQGVKGVREVHVRLDFGYEVGDTMMDLDPTIGKLIVTVIPEEGHWEERNELLRLASLAVLRLTDIRASIPAAGGSRVSSPINIGDHIRVLESRRARLHAAGINVGRDVDWVVDMYRNGEVLDASPYPPLMRPSAEDLEAPVVYAIHRADPHLVSVAPPNFFVNLEEKRGVLAEYLGVRTSSETRLSDLFGMPLPDGSRVGATIALDGKMSNAVLFDAHDRPVSIALSLEPERQAGMRFNIDYSGTVPRITSRSLLPDGDDVVVSFSPAASGTQSASVEIPGLGFYQLALIGSNGGTLLTIHDGRGNMLLRVRPHMGKAAVDHLNSLLAVLQEQPHTSAEVADLRRSFADSFVDIAASADPGSRTRTEFVTVFARSPYSITEDIFELTRYENTANPDLQRRVRALAREVMFFRYYDNDFHHVTGAETYRSGDGHEVAIGHFNDDMQSPVSFTPVEGRRVAWVYAEPGEEGISVQVESAARAALEGLRSGGNEVTEADVIEISVPQVIADDDEFTLRLRDALNQALGDTRLSRVTVSVYSKPGDSLFKAGDSFFTFRPTGGSDGLYQESTIYHEDFPLVPRHEHPRTSEQMERWRYRNFHAQNIPALYRGVYLTGLVGRTNPADRRIVADMQIRRPLVISGDTAPQLEEAVDQTLGELTRVMGSDQGGSSNRIKLFIRPPSSVPEELFESILNRRLPALRAARVERVSVQFPSEVPGEADRVLIADVNSSDRVVIRQGDVSFNSIVSEKTTYDLAVRGLHEKGNLAPAEKAALIFDGGLFQELRFDPEGDLVENDFDPFPSRKDQTVRGFVGLVGGQKTYVINHDPLNPRKGLAFDMPDGEIIKAFIDRAQLEKDGAGRLVGAPLIKVEELSSGANLYVAGDRWAATDPLASFGSEFQARYSHAMHSGRPNITLIGSLVVGGGIYGPEGSHVVISIMGLAVAALTGGNAAAYATGAVPVLKGGQVVPEGGTAQFNERISGSAQVHSTNGVFKYTVLSDRVRELLSQGIPVQDLEQHLTPEEKIELWRLGLEETRQMTLLLDNQVEGVVDLDSYDASAGAKAFEEYINDPVFHILRTKKGKDMMDALNPIMKERRGKAILPFQPVLEKLAYKDKADHPLVKIYAENWAPDLLCGWMVIPVRQADGSLKPESVAFMMNDPSGPKRGAITPEACRKAEEFLEVNSRLGRTMVRFAGSPGFLANDAAEAQGIEQMGKRAMDKIIPYNGPMVTLEIFEDCGGAQIFMGEMTLAAENQIVTYALNHEGVRLAPLPRTATAGIIGASRMRALADDDQRAQFFGTFAEQTTESGSPKRALQNQAVKGVIEVDDVPLTLSDGVKVAREQREAFRQSDRVHLARTARDARAAAEENPSAVLAGLTQALAGMPTHQREAWARSAAETGLLTLLGVPPALAAPGTAVDSQGDMEETGEFFDLAHRAYSAGVDADILEDFTRAVDAGVVSDDALEAIEDALDSNGDVGVIGALMDRAAERESAALDVDDVKAHMAFDGQRHIAGTSLLVRQGR